MNHSERPHLPSGARRALHGLILLLPATLTLKDAHAFPCIRQLVRADIGRQGTGNSPYLPAVGPAPLRFAAAPEVPDSSPPRPVSEVPSDSTGSSEENIAAEPTPPPDVTTVSDAKTESKETPPNKETPGILWDDAHPAVRPEDFLPYFQIPGGKQPGEVTIVVPVPRSAPAPAPLPPSSATYTQTPQ
ncbi:MAG: hypothetical protein ACREH8_11265 [Opitutaceae bacterium]